MNWLRTIFGGATGNTLSPQQQARLAAWRALPGPDLDAPHLRTRYVVVDIEASGLDQKLDRLISIGAVAVNGGMIDMLDAFEVVLRQDEVSDNANILIHGIGASAQREGEEPAEALLDFLDYVGKAPLVAYHAFFDQGMIDKACKRQLGFRPEFIWHDLAWLLPELFADRISGIVGLDTWQEQFKIDNYRRHNAVSDCLATAQLLQIAMCRASQLGLDSSRQLSLAETARRSLRRS
jgi:DNA polymerase-3 subunit epsilon